MFSTFLYINMTISTNKHLINLRKSDHCYQTNLSKETWEILRIFYFPDALSPSSFGSLDDYWIANFLSSLPKTPQTTHRAYQTPMCIFQSLL